MIVHIAWRGISFVELYTANSGPESFLARAPPRSWSATETASASAATTRNTTFYNGFRMESNRRHLPISDVLLFGDASLEFVSNIQHLANVKMSLQPTVFSVFAITIRFPGSPQGRVWCALSPPGLGIGNTRESNVFQALW